MATTRIWKVMNNLPRVVEYAKDGNKTANPEWSKSDYQAMRDVMDYAMNDYKTEQQYYVTALNCNADYARDQMQMTKKQYGKTDGILAWHGYQSFAEGEVDADTAHKVGVMLAKELWPDFQVIVATHLNTHCYHNHFVLNSVSFLHGKKFNACKDSYRKMRAVSDRLCKEHGLSVIVEHQAYYPKHYVEWEAEKKGERTWRTAIREDVDKAIMQSMTWSAFIRSLKDQGYDVKTNVKHIAIRPLGKERFVRLRSLGAQYTEEAIRQRILKQRSPARPPRPQERKVIRAKVYGDFRLSKVTWKGLRALYFFYLRKIREAQRQPQGYAPHAVREELRSVDKLNEQTLFLFKHKIDTVEQLHAFRQSAEAQITTLALKRKELSNEKRRTNTPSERREQIDAALKDISAQLKGLRHDVKLCGEIETRSALIAEIQKKLKEKELINDVPTRRSGRTGRGYGDEYDGKRH